MQKYPRMVMLVLFFYFGNVAAAVDTDNEPVRSALDGVSKEIAYEAFLNLLATIGEEDHHSYLHLLGDALQVNVDSEDHVNIHRVDLIGQSLIAQRRAMKIEQVRARWHLLCESRNSMNTAADYLRRTASVDAAIKKIRKTHLQLSLSEMEPRSRGDFNRFLTDLSGGIGYVKTRPEDDLRNAGSVAALLDNNCKSIEDEMRGLTERGMKR